MEGQIFTENSYAKQTPIMSAKHGKRSTFNGPHLNQRNGQDDIAFVSPISSTRNRALNGSIADNPGDETKELADLVENETNPRKNKGISNIRRNSRQNASKGVSGVNAQEQRKSSR